MTRRSREDQSEADRRAMREHEARWAVFWIAFGLIAAAVLAQFGGS